MNKVSVCTICLNSEKEIAATILSVLDQSFTDYELIIKDGGSTDRTLPILRQIKEKYNNHNIHIVSSADAGIYSAMNQALEYAKGEYCIFLNSGDLFSDGYSLERVLPYLDGKNDVVYADAEVSYDGYVKKWQANIGIVTKNMPFCHQACLIKTDLLKSYRFNEEYRIAGDYDLILRLYLDKRIFANTGTVISRFYLNGISSMKYIERLKERYAVRCNNGVVNENYRFSLRYNRDMGIEIIKTVIDAVLPERLLRSVKKFYLSRKYRNA